jgi:radical SAM superfamily enzyme YgiQ (UPF0313 family)
MNHSKILLINTPISFKHDGIKNEVELLPHLPFGLISIATFLEQYHYKTIILDLWSFPDKISELDFYLTREEIHFVGINICSPTLSVSWEIGKYIKRLNPSIEIICGGIHPTILPLTLFSNKSPFDYIVTGRGEYAMLQILEKRYTSNKIKRHIIIPENYPSFSEIGFPNYDLININEYISRRDEIPIIISIGCKLKCNYCSSTAMYNGVYITKSIDQVIQEVLSFQRKYNCNRFIFESDNLLNFSKQEIVYLMKLIQKLDTPIKWRGLTRLDLTSKYILDLIIDSGCYELFIGVDIANSVYSKTICRSINFLTLEENIKQLYSRQIKLQASFIIGFPEDDNLEYIINTINYINKLFFLGVEEITIFPLYIYPGSYYWKIGGEGILFGAIPFIFKDEIMVSDRFRYYLQRYPLFPEVSLIKGVTVGQLMCILAFAYDSIGCNVFITLSHLNKYLRENNHITCFFDELSSSKISENYNILKN